MTENAEDRFKRAMDRLFSPAATPPTSIAGRDRRDSGSGVIDVASRLVNQATKLSSPAVEANVPPPNLHRVCRPWDRKDLFRRLATFKSMTWFGKPEVVGPVNCARNGWVNVDVDLIACEGCNAMLSFPCPPTWSQHEVESAAATFSESMDSGHKAFCPWKENACSETLAQFPPTPVEALAEAFQDRCDALNQLSGLPVLSSSTLDYLKKSKGPQVEHFISQPVSNLARANGIPNGASVVAAASTFYQVQRIISLCGWELRLLPYVVDCEDDNTMFLRKDASSKSKTKHADPGPKVLLYHSKKQKTDENEERSSNAFKQEQKCDIGSAVLDCSLCGASVGLWLFSKITRPSSWMMAEPLRDPVGCELSAASGIQRGSCGDQREEKTEKSVNVADAVTSCLAKVESKPANLLTLNLTIAGGPCPTQLLAQSTGPVLPSLTEFDPLRKGGDILKPLEDLGVKQATQEGDLIGKTSSSRGIGEEKRGDTTIRKKRKWHGAAGLEDREVMERGFLSSVDAIDTCILSRPENSAESVGMPQKHPNTVTRVEDNDSISQRSRPDAQAEHDSSNKNVGVSSHKSNASPSVDSKRAVEETALDVLPDGTRPNDAAFEANCCESKIKNLRLDGVAASSFNRRMSNEGSTELSSSPERSNDLKSLFDESVTQFDPIVHHRHFCPWVNSYLERGSCGWQLTLDALESSPPAVKSDSATSVYNADPLSSVRKIFGRSPTGPKAPNKQ